MQILNGDIAGTYLLFRAAATPAVDDGGNGRRVYIPGQSMPTFFGRVKADLPTKRPELGS